MFPEKASFVNKDGKVYKKIKPGNARMAENIDNKKILLTSTFVK
tara:strand:- start:127 stop:258 length:132 start_codon:yes stop_codon:yes gene_type:complete